MAFWSISKNLNRLRIIDTARDKDSINRAVEKGYLPLIKKVKPSKKICSKYSVLRNKKTGEIEVIGDFRSGIFIDNKNDYEIVIDWTYYYPYNFKSPFAAYLIPKDIKIGERVYIKDLIEDFIGAKWNQGNVYRLESCEAIWNGTHLEIQYDAKASRSTFIG